MYSKILWKKIIVIYYGTDILHGIQNIHNGVLNFPLKNTIEYNQTYPTQSAKKLIEFYHSRRFHIVMEHYFHQQAVYWTKQLPKEIE